MIVSLLFFKVPLLIPKPHGGHMSTFRSITLGFLLSLCLGTTAMAEGFAMTEWSARGIGLAGGLVGRADDVSTIAYNAAGLTQLPGTHIMGGMSFIAPYGSINFDDTGHTTSTKLTIWTPGHGYASHQLSDRVWLGFGLFTRYGLGNNYSDEWRGSNTVHGVGVTTLSAVPTIAIKLNDVFSVSAGVEIMYMSMFLNSTIPAEIPGLGRLDIGSHMEADSVGVGFHLGLHAQFNEYWSAGLTYKSQVVQNLDGEATFSSSLSPNSGIKGTITLPDSVALGIAFKPLDNLSFEVGAVWTRWSTFKALDIHFDDGREALNPKKWKDGWNFNASVEYSPLDWLTLRAGYWHETDVTNDNYADYMMPTNGRDALSLGVGLKYENWTLDLAYTHMWIYDTEYSNHSVTHTYPGNSSNVGADLYTVSIGYSF